MKIVCAGMRRSGSTWLYNVARLACLEHGTTYASFEDRLAGATEAEYIVVKAHKFDQALRLAADFVLVTYRDLRDVAASAVRRGLCRPTCQAVIPFLLKTAVAEFEAWEAVACHSAAYETITKDKAAAVGAVVSAIGLDCDFAKLSSKVEALPLPGQGANHTSLLHHDHFTDGGVGTYRKTINDEIATAIESVFGPWMRSRGYDVPSTAKDLP